MNPGDELLLDVLAQSQRRGYLGSGDLCEHVQHARAHCSAASPESGQRWCDLGSGGGVPGLIMALDRPKTEFVLLDRSQNRSEFLSEAIRRLGIGDRVRIACGDATQLAHQRDHRHAYDGVVSRAFGPPAAVAECSSGLVRPGGRLVVSEPPGSSAPRRATPGPTKPRVEPQRWPAEGLMQLGWEFVGFSGQNPAFAILKRRPSHLDDYPRPWKQIRKRPLF